VRGIGRDADHASTLTMVQTASFFAIGKAHCVETASTLGDGPQDVIDIDVGHIVRYLSLQLGGRPDKEFFSSSMLDKFVTFAALMLDGFPNPVFVGEEFRIPLQ
jgi:hypothetical protein